MLLFLCLVQWFNDADPDVLHHCKIAMEFMEGLGAKTVEIRIPELHMSHIAHTVVIGVETAAVIGPAAKSRKMRRIMNDDIALGILSGEAVTSADYIQTQVSTQLFVLRLSWTVHLPWLQGVVLIVIFQYNYLV